MALCNKYRYLILIFLLLSVAIVCSFYYVLKPQKRLPIFQPAGVSKQLVDSGFWHVKKHHTISDFKLVNQNGDTISQQDYKGKIYVADFFFTTCPGICPLMTKNMKTLQDQFQKDPEVLLLSHSVTPEIDSVSVLKKYAEYKGVNQSKWNLLTGSRKQIYNLARKSYLVVKLDHDGEAMIHTENFVLVDKKRRIRGFYDGTSKDDMQKLKEDIETLKKEG